MYLIYLAILTCAFSSNCISNGQTLSVTAPTAYNISDADNVEDKDMVLAFLVHRHGERMPDEEELSLAHNPEKWESYVKLYGLEGLTNIGKQRAYQLGKFIRERYGGSGLISKLYVPSEIDVRSTDKDRTKMTALVAMAGAYPPLEAQQWDRGLGELWQPIPYITVPLDQDYLRYYSNCPKYMALMAQAQKDSLIDEFEPFKDLINITEHETGRNFKENLLLFQSIIDLHKSANSLGIETPQWSKPHIPRLNEAAVLAYALYFKNHEMIKIGAGVLLNNFLQLASDIQNKKPVTKRLRIFSAHDFNVGALMFATGLIKKPSIPDYGSAFALELYRSKSSGKLSVMGMYLNQAGSSIAETYRFKGCETSEYCALEKFISITKPYALSVFEYYQLSDIKVK